MEHNDQKLLSDDERQRTLKNSHCAVERETERQTETQRSDMDTEDGFQDILCNTLRSIAITVSFLKQ